MLKRQNSLSKEDSIIQQFIDSIGFTKYHYLVFLVGALILITNGMQIILQAFIMGLLNTIEQINLYDLAVVNFSENIGYSIAYIVIMFYGKYLKSKTVIQVLAVLSLVCNGLGIIILNYRFIVFNRMMIGMWLGGLDILIFVMLVEMFPSKIRGFMSSIVLAFNPLGQVISSLIAFWSLDEQQVENNYNLLLRIPFFILLVVVILVIFIQESPRSYFEEGKFEKGIATYLSKDSKIANLLRRQTIDLEDEEKKSHNSSQFKVVHDNLKFKDLFTQPLNYTLTIIAFSLFTGFIYNGVYFLLPTNAPKLTRSEVSKLIISVAVDIPSNIVASIIIESKFFGRRGSMMLGWLFCIVFSLYCVVEPESVWGMILIKFGVAIAISVIIVYSCELFPKNLRTSIVSLFNLGKRLSTMVSPLVVSWVEQSVSPNLVFVIFALMSSVSLMLNFMLKIETKDKGLDDLEVLTY